MFVWTGMNLTIPEPQMKQIVKIAHKRTLVKIVIGVVLVIGLIFFLKGR